MTNDKIYAALLEIGGDAVFMVDRDLRVCHSCSTSCQLLFQREIGNLPLADILDIESSGKDALFVGIQQLFDNIMEPAVVVSMLPNRISTMAARHWQWSYAPVTDDSGAAVRLIISIKDITERIMSDQAREAEIKRLHTVINILQQGAVFGTFLEDTNNDFSRLTECGDLTTGKRILHTLKGNFGAMGLTDISTAIHDMEQRLVTDHAKSDASSLMGYFALCARDVAQYLDRFLADNENFLGFSRPGCADASDNHPSAGLGSATFGVFGEERVFALVKSFRPQIEKLAERLNKKINFIVEGGDTLVDEARYSPVIREMIHLIRNSCDHGIEKKSARVEKGKPEEGTIRLLASETQDQVLFTVIDDGGGIAADKIRDKAVKMGIVSQEAASGLSEAGIFALIFCDGVSSSDQITSVSGRGVGLAALKAEVDRLGGTITVTSRMNLGTTFEIALPKVTKHAKAA